jgi:hypothetical protein
VYFAGNRYAQNALPKLLHKISLKLHLAALKLYLIVTLPKYF